jgi:4-diphosphocytidyl-2-C-methyl-D-erythritol kinase
VTAVAHVLAPAKVNLRLRVLRRRSDGYHDLDTLFQAIDLADEIAVELRGEGIALDVQGADLGPVVDNLAYRAAERLAARVGYDGGIAVSPPSASPPEQASGAARPTRPGCCGA